VGQDEAVDADHDRDREFLGEAKGLDVEVRRLLVALGEELNPSRVADRHCVAVVVPDVDGRTDGAIRERHDDR
jgi:hypothetical protein